MSGIENKVKDWPVILSSENQRQFGIDVNVCLFPTHAYSGEMLTRNYGPEPEGNWVCVEQFIANIEKWDEERRFTA